LILNEDLMLKRDNYENYLDDMTTKVQRHVRGMLARRRFKRLSDTQSIKVFQCEFIQDGEDMVFYLMKKYCDKCLTCFVYNFTDQKMFEPLVVDQRKLEQLFETNRLDPKETYLNIFRILHFDCETNKMYLQNFFMNSPDHQNSYSEDLISEQLAKVKRYAALYEKRFSKTFHKKEFLLGSRYLLQGKKFLVYQDVPINLLVSWI
jgi:hypothetical protein